MNFLKKISITALSNLSLSILNDSDSNVSENEPKPYLKKVKLTIKILNYNKSYVEYG